MVRLRNGWSMSAMNNTMGPHNGACALAQLCYGIIMPYCMPYCAPDHASAAIS